MEMAKLHKQMQRCQAWSHDKSQIASYGRYATTNKDFKFFSFLKN